MSNDLFIQPGLDLESTDPRLQRVVSFPKEELRQRWATVDGQSMIAQWKASGYARETLDRLLGRYYGHTDIRGIPLPEEDLQGVDLGSVDLYGADLHGANLERANLRDSWLSETDIRATRFDWAAMDGVLIDAVRFDHQTRFYGVNLNAINFTLAALLQDAALSQQRIVELENSHPSAARVLRWTCDYGRSFSRFFLWVFGVILIFGMAYYVLPGATTATALWDNLYFSVITFTTLGYGDFAPLSWLGKALVVIEVLIGYLMLGLLVGILSRRVIRG